MSGFIHGAREASANSCEAYAVGLSVAVEGITNLIKIKRSSADTAVYEEQKKVNKDLKKFIIAAVGNSSEYKPYKERITNMLSSINRERPIDKLRWLASINIIEVKHFCSWRDLRNKNVHASVNSELYFCEINFQKKINALFDVTDLLYRLVFYIINYKGTYTDYSTVNWPSKNYP